MNEPAILAAVAPRYRAKLVHRIGEDDVNHLRAVCALVGPTLEFRQADVARATGMKAPSALKLVDRLVAKKVLRPVRTEGTNKYYAPTGEASVALEAALRTG